jgi:hypothetical protein
VGQVSFHSGAPSHPKLMVLSDGAFRLWFTAVCYCAEHLTDGVLPKAVVPMLKRQVSGKQIAELTTLVVPGYTSPLWEDCGDSYRVHDYLDWQDSREEVQRGRARLRERVKRHRNGSSTPPCNGVTPPVTNPVTNPRSNPVGTEGNSEQRTVNTEHRTPDTVCHTVPLGRRGLVDVAWPGRPAVPGMLHAELRELLGGEADQADGKLRAWYPTVAEQWADKPIGDDAFRFWRARFREWVGTTVTGQSDRSKAVEDFRRRFGARAEA